MVQEVSTGPSEAIKEVAQGLQGKGMSLRNEQKVSHTGQGAYDAPKEEWV